MSNQNRFLNEKSFTVQIQNESPQKIMVKTMFI
jgi:hypothetical protein